jgi:hypothetical protein
MNGGIAGDISILLTWETSQSSYARAAIVLATNVAFWPDSFDRRVKLHSNPSCLMPR